MASLHPERRRGAVGRGLAAAALGLTLAWACPLPAQAQVCLDCFTETLGVNPFTTPLVMPTQWLWTSTAGLAGPTDDPAWLPNLQAKYGLRDGLEAQATLGYEPALGLRGLVASTGGVNVLAAGRVGWAFFRQEWLGQVSAPVLWSGADGRMLRLEPGFTVNQATGNHVNLQATVTQLLAPGTALAFGLEPDYRLASQMWTGVGTMAVTRALNPYWAVYVVGALNVIQEATPMIAVGITQVGLPRE